jgi:hypothetical protein
VLVELENVMATEGWSCFVFIVFTTPSRVRSENVNKTLYYKGESNENLKYVLSSNFLNTKGTQ